MTQIDLDLNDPATASRIRAAIAEVIAEKHADAAIQTMRDASALEQMKRAADAAKGSTK